MQLFAIQSCPILHGPVIVFDSRDVEILKQLGVSSIANESPSASSDSLVRDLEEAKDICKGEFSVTQQLPDILPKTIHTTVASRILRSRRRVPFQHKACTTYTQVMKYFKSSPAALEFLEGRQFALAKSTVTPAAETPLKPPTAARKAKTSKQKAPRVSPPAPIVEPKGNVSQTKDVGVAPRVPAVVQKDEAGQQNDIRATPELAITAQKGKASHQEEVPASPAVPIFDTSQLNLVPAIVQKDKAGQQNDVRATPEVAITAQKSKASHQEEVQASPAVPIVVRTDETSQLNLVPSIVQKDKGGQPNDARVSPNVPTTTMQKDAVSQQKDSRVVLRVPAVVQKDNDSLPNDLRVSPATHESIPSDDGDKVQEESKEEGTKTNEETNKVNEESPEKVTEEAPIESNETPKVSNVSATDDGTGNDSEGKKTESAESIPIPQNGGSPEALPPPPDLQEAPRLAIAEAIKIRKRSSAAVNPSPVIPSVAPPATAERKRGRSSTKGPHPAKKRGRPPKNRSLPTQENKAAISFSVNAETPGPTGAINPTTVAPIPRIENMYQLPNPSSVSPSAVPHQPVKKRGRPPNVKPVVEAVRAQVPSPVVAAPEAVVAPKPHGRPPKAKPVAAALVGVPPTKKRGRPPKAKPSSPPKKRGRPPKSKAVVETTTTTSIAQPALAPPAKNQLPISSTVTPSHVRTVPTTTNTTAITTTDALVLSPPRKSQPNMDDEPYTPGNATNYTSDGSSIGEPFTPIIESPITSPAGSEHFSTRNAGAKWNEKFLELFRYKMQFGNCNVSAKANDNPHKALGEWVRIQRRRKNGKSKSLKPLSMEEEAKLNAIGFDWRSASKLEWEHGYQKLVEFKMAFGHANVPREYPENPTLAAWCASQREFWRQKLSDENVDVDELQESSVADDGKKRKYPMTDEQEGKLLALGFEF
ncbi:MAG: hypothetical protein SGBAC_009947 [Bacillariaceae sp.]